MGTGVSVGVWYVVAANACAGVVLAATVGVDGEEVVELEAIVSKGDDVGVDSGPSAISIFPTAAPNAGFESA